MNDRLLKKFSAEILSGAASLGVASGLARGILSSDKASALEKQTGRSVAELAILGIQANATIEKQERHRELVSETLELMKAFDSALPKAKEKVGRRAAVR